MNKVQRLTRLAGVAFIFCVLMMAAVSALKRNVYDSVIGINLLVVTDGGMGILTVRNSENLTNMLVLPNNLVVSVGGKELQIEGLWRVGPVAGMTYEDIRLGVGRTMGLVLGGVIRYRGGLEAAEVNRAMVTLSSVTNLSIVDRISMGKDLTGLVTKGTRMESNLPMGVMETVEEPDGKRVLRVNNAIFTWGQNQWSNDSILSESGEITVVNASGVEGVGRMISRQLETSGIRVIEVGAGNELSDGGCEYWGDGDKLPLTTAFLRKQLGCREGSGGAERFYDKPVKSDIMVVIGKDH